MRAVTAILLAPFAILALDWSQRVPCGDSWEGGLAPAAFVTGAISVVIALRISALRRQGRAGTRSLAAAGVWLAAAATWWSAGISTPMFLWAAVCLIGLVAAVPAATTLTVMIAVRPSWPLVSGLAWLCAIVLVPGLVAVVETWDC